jgi:hypothetical protein
MFETPLSIYLLLPSSIFILIISLFLLISKRQRSYFIFFIIGVLQFVWAFGAFLLWQTHGTQQIIMSPLYDKLLSMAIFLIPVFLYHFSVEFCKVSSQKIHLFISYILAFVFVSAINTEDIISGIFFYKFGAWDNSSIVFYLFCFFIFSLLILSLYNLLRFLNRKEWDNNKVIAYNLVLGLSIFGLVFVEFLPVQGINIYPLFYLTIPIYALILAYVVIENNPFAVIITTDVLVAVTITFFASLIIFQELEMGILERSVLFVLISVTSFLLLKYTYRLRDQNQEFDIKLKERTKELEDQAASLKKIKQELEKANVILEVKIKERTEELQELNENLEKEVEERTGELQKKKEELEEKIIELKEFSNIFVNRENKMVELKNKIKILEEKINKK